MTTLPPNFYLINKPANWTSFDVVGYIRKIARTKTGGTPRAESRGIKRVKVGHAGTLDPFATGLLIVGVGRDATRTIDQFKNLPKTYRATIKLGETSSTGDPTGVISAITPNDNGQGAEGENFFRNERPSADGSSGSKKKIFHRERPSNLQIAEVLKSFLGPQTQVPPMHSAKQINGIRLYKLARQGKEVDREPNHIEIFNLSLVSYSYPELTVDVTCSPGTYIRTLAEDIGTALGTGAYCLTLERTAIGPYSLTDAVAPEQVVLS